MKTPQLLLISILASVPAFASLSTVAQADVITRLSRVQPSGVPGELEVFSAADGRVYSVKTTQTDLVRDLRAFERAGLPVLLQLDRDGDEVVGVASAASAPSDPSADPSAEHVALPANLAALGAVGYTGAAGIEGLKSEDEAMPFSYAEASADGFKPSVFTSMTEADQLFSSLRPLKHKSQCHERAMVWSYDMWAKSHVKSMKVVLFFTEKFRRTFYTDHWYGRRAYKWWYHTAPFVYVRGQEVVLDPEFVDRSKPMHDWTHFFLSELLSTNAKRAHLTRAETVCHEMRSYAEINTNRADWCLTRKLPMYYMQPNSFEAHDGAAGPVIKRLTWDMGDVKLAYKHAPPR